MRQFVIGVLAVVVAGTLAAGALAGQTLASGWQTVARGSDRTSSGQTRVAVIGDVNDWPAARVRIIAPAGRTTARVHTACTHYKYRKRASRDYSFRYREYGRITVERRLPVPMDGPGVSCTWLVIVTGGPGRLQVWLDVEA